MLTVIKSARPRLVRFATTDAKKPLIDADIMKRVEQKLNAEGFVKAEQAKPAEGSRITEMLVGGTFLASVLAGTYLLTRPVENEPKYIATSEWWMKPFQRANYRVLSVYKGMVDPDTDCLLPDPFPLGHPYYKPYTLVIELEKALVKSSWSKEEGWKVAKRPWADYFLAYMSQFYEVVVFTSQQPTYAMPVLDKLDGGLGAIQYRLYKDSTRYDIQSGDQVKDLTILNRNPARVIMLDPEPRHYQTTQPENVIEMPPWEGDPSDTYLLDLIPFMETLGYSGVDDVRLILENYKGKDVPKTFAENMARVQEAQRLEYERSLAGSSADGGVWKSIQDGLLSFIGLGGRPAPSMLPASQEEFKQQQMQQHQRFISEIEHHKKATEAEQKRHEEEYAQMMDKTQAVRVSLYEMLIYGVDDAIKRKLDPEVREYMEKMQAQQIAQ